jgi:hypothetical protein
MAAIIDLTLSHLPAGTLLRVNFPSPRADQCTPA